MYSYQGDFEIHYVWPTHREIEIQARFAKLLSLRQLISSELGSLRRGKGRAHCLGGRRMTNVDRRGFNTVR
jgi:hypothetical protein